jgi:hypothetical protein
MVLGCLENRKKKDLKENPNNWIQIREPRSE